MGRLAGRAGLFVFAFVLGAASCVAFAAFAVTGSSYPNLEVFAKVLAHVENNYVEEVNEKQLIYGAIRGMLATLDPHTSFMDPEEYSGVKKDNTDKSGGLGFEFTRRDDALVVVGPIDDTPGSRAGIRPGDIVTALGPADNKVSARWLSVEQANERLSGPPGSEIVLDISRPEFAKPRPLALKREHIRVVSVDGRVIDGMGYLKVRQFQDHTDSDLKAKLDELRAESGGKIKGLVLDLRNNPGGFLDQGVKVADRFIAKGGLIVTTKGRNGRHREDEKATGKNTEPDYPLVVLVNGGTASASEVLAGALKDHGRAVILGTTSFGKGSVQTIIELEDGSMLKLTIARYYTPSGCSIQGIGIVPDVIVEDGTGPRNDPSEGKLQGALANDSCANGSSTAKPVAGDRVIGLMSGGDRIDDPQLKSAVAALLQWNDFRKAISVERANLAHGGARP